MAPKWSERQQAILFAVVLVASIAVLYAATLAVQPADVRPAVVHSVRLEIEGPGWTIRYGAPTTSNNTAFALLIEASTRLGFVVHYRSYQIPEGVFVLAINGSSNGEGQRYWQYWVNQGYADLAADRMALQDGDTVLWRFASPQEAA